MEREEKLRQLAELREQLSRLEGELAQESAVQPWQAEGYYGAYYATTGLMLGMIAAATSLVFNIVGSLVWTQWTGDALHPLRLIQVYLTFPLGAAALEINQGLALAIGCCLYLGTGALYGMVFQVVLTRWFSRSTWQMRLMAASVLGVVIWLVNFYGILSWLQPLMLGGNWIVELVPWWVAGLTHLVFAWTMWLVYPLGLYTPYRSPADS